jgi:hypothetical protein
VSYSQDGLQTEHNCDFLQDPLFRAAYQRGVEAAGVDYNWHWRVHTGLWAARTAMKIPGDFIEFGTNRGFLSSAIMHDLDWSSRGREFYLLDTFAGLDERFVSDAEKASGVLDRNRQEIASGFYTLEVESVRRNFAQWDNVTIVQGPVPLTLDQVPGDRFAFVHIDMNCSPPEVAALRFVWPKLSPGALIVLDDYAYAGYESQKRGMDELGAVLGFDVLSLPTGQGLIVKPA